MLKRVCSGFLVALVVMLAACGKERLFIPEVPVNFIRPLTDPSLSALNTGGSVIVKGYGVAGLLISRSGQNYVAFDCCSTVNPDQKCAVQLADPFDPFVTDPCSNARFLTRDGSPGRFPAEVSLKQYNVVITAGNVLQVQN
ncbi:hypothetical protein [Pedobacter sp. SYP-B3415]|uniref:hypothetical protein n=1 Tax=Pedobacter sp. SYP-B3415 TaxID=2496641 RepID=UPI00101CE9B2|nr:hypothetical protein [Pedobacter sp. SYP-B3415]